CARRARRPRGRGSAPCRRDPSINSPQKKRAQRAHFEQPEMWWLRRIARGTLPMMRASFLLSVFAFAVLASSCGTRQEAASRSAAAQPVAPTTNATNNFSGPWGVDIAQPEPKPGALPLTKQLTVFTKTRQTTNDLDFSEKTPPNIASKKELFSQSQLLLPEKTLENQQLFGIPTAND